MSFGASVGEAQVAPHFTHSVAPAEASPGSPRLLRLPALPAMDLRVAPNLSSFSTPGAGALEFPPQLRASGCACQCSPQVSPLPASSGFAGDRSTSCPAARILRRPWRWCFGFPLRLALPVAPPSEVADRSAPFTFRLCLRSDSSGCPSVSFPWRRLMVPQVASVPAPSGFAVPASSGCPESCIYGWVDDDFPVLLELCILGEAADESS